MPRVLLSLLLFFSFCYSQAQKPNPYQLRIINDTADYRKLITRDSLQELVDLALYLPDVTLDIRYATDQNFTGRAVYLQSRAFARLPVARALQGVQQELRKQGLSLKIYDAYRPYQVTRKFWDVTSDKRYVASPKEGSRHNRGCAVDVTLIDLASGAELQMPTDYDNFTEKAHSNYSKLPATELKNRELLKQLMKKHGFSVFTTEWWHYDFKGWEKYPLLDLSFEELDSLKK